jgi:cytochrome c-type biogenesis protein CcmH
MKTLQHCALMSLLLLLVSSAAAQENQPTISDDAVNAIASQMYCPVCENIPLDVCGTDACVEWREEIRIMLAQGMSAEGIRADFVRRYGERVVGTPQDPLLRALTLLTPFALGALALVITVGTLLRWRAGKAAALTQDSFAQTELRARLERDVAEAGT